MVVITPCVLARGLLFKVVTVVRVCLLLLKRIQFVATSVLSSAVASLLIVVVGFLCLGLIIQLPLAPRNSSLLLTLTSCTRKVCIVAGQLVIAVFPWVTSGRLPL